MVVGRCRCQSMEDRRIFPRPKAIRIKPPWARWKTRSQTEEVDPNAVPFMTFGTCKRGVSHWTRNRHGFRRNLTPKLLALKDDSEISVSPWGDEK